MTILKCEFDGHTYERPSQRGRPPKFCDLHKPKVDVVKITSSPAQNPAEKSTSVFDLVPGLEELVQQDKMRTLWCEHGDGHEYQQESRRGRLPRFCPEHREQALKSSNNQSRVISPEKKEEAQKKLEEAIQYHSQRVLSAEEADNEAYALLRQKSADDDIFNNWLRKNSMLLSEVIALRSQETKLITYD